MQIFIVRHIKGYKHELPAMRHQHVIKSVVVADTFMSAQAEARAQYVTDKDYEFIRHLDVGHQSAAVIGEIK